MTKDEKKKLEAFDALVIALRQTQTLLALIANDPGDPTNGHKAVDQFNRNKAILEPWPKARGLRSAT